MTTTPSERLLLAAASRDEGAAIDAPLVVRAPSDQAVHEMLAAALLANEQAGAVTLEPATAKRLFGLRTVPVLRVRPTTRAAAGWPPDTLESRVLAAALWLTAKEKDAADDVCGEVVESDESPEGETVSAMLRALTARGLVAERSEQKTVLKVFKTTQRSSVVTPRGADALRDGPAAGATALLETCRRDRADVWALLWKAVTRTYAQRTQSRDTGAYGSSD